MAGDLKYVGYHDLVFGPIVVDYGPHGCTTHFTVTCSTQLPLINYYNYIVTFGASGTFHGLDFGHDGATTGEEKRLEVSIPGLVNNLGNLISELYFDQWELLSNETTDSVFANPLLVYGSPPVLNYNDNVVLSRLARDGGTITSAVASCNSDIADGNLLAPDNTTGPNGGGTSGGQFQKPGTTSSLDAYGGTAPGQIGREILKGQTEYEKSVYVLRHTSYCSAGATYNTSLSNTQKIMTPAQVLSECGSGWTYNLPNRLYSKIAAIPYEYAAYNESPYYTWGWLKKITREPVQSNFIVEVSTEYVLGLWSNLRFAVA